MVKVANDPALHDGDLPAPARSRAVGEPEVSGISLRLIAGLAAGVRGAVHATGAQLDVSVDSTTPLRTALHAAELGDTLTHQLVLADATALAEATEPVAGATGAAAVATLADAGAAGLVLSGVEGAPSRALRDAARRVGLALIDVPLEAVATFTTEVLSAILAHQTATLRRLED